MAEYIDRDLALSFPFGRGEYDHEHADPHFINGCETYREWLEQIPAADVAPVAHAHWREENRLPRSSKFYCTACHRTAYDPQPTRLAEYTKRCRYAYCPNCGAVMDERSEDNGC